MKYHDAISMLKQKSEHRSDSEVATINCGDLKMIVEAIERYVEERTGPSTNPMSVENLVAIFNKGAPGDE